ncbi:MAG TPA: PAS domain S-box protein [Anaerolineae bacterium]|nr:PAS domain S-box protein [Anaerolineae bacterium]HQI84557.1 PAS domain S-box protein [Anaerolineae bacterium]
MKAQSIPVVVIAGISFYVGLYHLLIYVRRKQHREDLIFALLCLATGCYDVFCAGLYNASSAVEGAPWQRLQFIALACLTSAFLWFVSEYVGQKPGPITYAFSTFYLLAVVIQSVDRSPLTWLLDQPAVKTIVLPFGRQVTYYEATLGPFTVVQGIMGMVVSTYILWLSYRYYRQGYRREASPLLLALGFMYATAINDTLVSQGIYQFIYGIEYGYLAMILLMAYSLSSTVVEAAMAKESLRVSEERFRSLVETTSDWVWETDANGVYTYASPKSRDLLGYAPEEILGTTPFDLMFPEEKEHVSAAFRAAVDNHKTFERLENTARHKDGHLVVLETNGVPFYDANGKLVGYRGIDRDITRRKQAEAALLQSEERYRALSELSLDFAAAFRPGPDGELVNEWNFGNLMHITGYTSDELIALGGMAGITHPDDFSLLEQGTQALIAGQTYMHEYRIITKGGQVRWLRGYGYTVKDAQGCPIHFYRAAQDITERKQAEESLRESEEKFRSIVENALVGIFMVDDAYRFVYINDELCRILQHSREELAGMDFRQVLSDESRAFVANYYVRRQSGEQLPPRYELSVIRRDGQVRHAEMSVAVVRDAAGRSRTMGQLVDITERKQAEREREVLIAELEAKNAELERFTYTVSHDLKSPLITIGGFVGFLEKDTLSGDTERIKADIARINEALARMQRLLDELLELSRIGRIMNPPEAVSFAAIVHEAVESVRGRIEARGVEVDIAPDLPTVYGDRVRLVEVVQNLVDNACKFMGEQPHPRIEIGVRQSETEPVFYVRDNGIGIEPQYHTKVFGLFDKLDPHSDGTGVGLALVKRIIETHGGKIWVESEGVGRGSAFCFTLASAT